ncbi:MAG: aminomethyl-transferring glycine dehydrogenase subunit GcvPA, partial [Ignavibacteriales bacterium]|nr:aminomethyl-transferring glycine dehydrogenase subunit GcvPA [Ignavibacteriales bacterium]
MTYSDNREFQRRHIGPEKSDLQSMLDAVGVASLDELIDQTVPIGIRCATPLDLGAPMTEAGLLQHLRSVASRNRVLKSFIGQGYYGCHTPSVILRNIFENPGWYTQYTPYQPEISQGRLEALLNFQTMVSDLTGMEVANASLLDEGTAAAEAMTMSYGIVNKGRSTPANRIFVSDKVFVQTIDVVRARAIPLGIDVVVGDHTQWIADQSYFAALFQYPAEDGAVIDYRSVIRDAHAAGMLAIVAADLMSLALLTPPGELGADIVVGNSQRFGVPMGYGGPHAAFFATKNDFIRQMPGRIIGVSVDVRGNRAFRMTLQTREQHIRREKATSNICTAQALLAIMAGMYAVYHGPRGIRAIASRIHRSAMALEAMLRACGYQTMTPLFFDTITVDVAKATNAASIAADAVAAGYNLRMKSATRLSIALDETATEDDLYAIARVFAKIAGKTIERTDVENELNSASCVMPEPFARTSSYLTHPVFSLHHAENEMMRYIKSLEKKDLSMTQSMIPLGSCTMKL